MLSCLVSFIAGLIVGYLDPIVIWKKINNWLELTFFPWASNVKNKWKEEVEQAKKLKEEEENSIDAEPPVIEELRESAEKSKEE